MAFELGMSIVLTETAARRDDWVEGVPILLEDDSEWHFPKPVIELRVKLSGAEVDFESGPAPVDNNRRFSQAYWDQVERWRAEWIKPTEESDGTAGYKLLIGLAVGLLRRNYNIPDDQIGRLLIVLPGDARNQQSWDAIRGVILGHGKKAGAAD